jgi:hypothetical protein
LVNGKSAPDAAYSRSPRYQTLIGFAPRTLGGPRDGMVAWNVTLPPSVNATGDEM